MVNAVSDYYKLECEIRSLKSELDECQTMYIICNTRREEILQENMLLKKEIIYLKELNNGLNYKRGVGND